MKYSKKYTQFRDTKISKKYFFEQHNIMDIPHRLQKRWERLTTIHGAPQTRCAGEINEWKLKTNYIYPTYSIYKGIYLEKILKC